MRAAVVPGFGQPLVIEDRPVPEPGPGQVVVRMEASGLCHTDIHAANGDWPVTPTVPFIPGHEGVGVITAVGAGVTSPVAGAPRRPLPLLPDRLGDAVRGAAEPRLSGRRLPRRILPGRGRIRRPRPG